MMHSDSFISTNGVPPYLRAYASRESYTRIGGGEEGPARIGAQGIFRLKRAVGAVAVLVVFVAAVATSKPPWVARGAPIADKLLQDGGRSYRGVFEAFEVRFNEGHDGCLLDFSCGGFVETPARRFVARLQQTAVAAPRRAPDRV